LGVVFFCFDFLAWVEAAILRPPFKRVRSLFFVAHQMVPHPIVHANIVPYLTTSPVNLSAYFSFFFGRPSPRSPFPYHPRPTRVPSAVHVAYPFPHSPVLPASHLAPSFVSFEKDLFAPYPLPFFPFFLKHIERSDPPLSSSLNHV